MTQIAEGMEVTAHSDLLLEYRRAVTEMMFLERNHVCAVCVANNHCELQDMADELGVTHFDLPRISPKVDIDASHRLFAIDHNRCILCLRCVRVCDEIEGAHTWDVMHRGLETRVQTDMGIPWGESHHLHELRQVRPGLPDRGPVREGPAGRPRQQDQAPVPAVDEGRRRGAWAVSKPRVATVWLDGCSGCHMSLIDLDERLLDIFERADLVYGPLVDFKEYPEDVDVCLVEGAVSSEDDLHKIKLVRERTKTLIAFGDCAVTSNVPGMRNPIGVAPLLDRAYLENVTLNPQLPDAGRAEAPADRAPVHRFVKVDVFLPGCPPSADLIYTLLDDLLSGRVPERRRRPVRALTGARHEPDDHHRSGHPDRGPFQDHDPARRPRRGRRRPLPRHPVPRLRAHHAGPPGPRDARDHGPHLRDLPGQPPGRLGQGRRRHPGRRAAAHRGRTCAGSSTWARSSSRTRCRSSTSRRRTCCSASTPTRPCATSSAWRGRTRSSRRTGSACASGASRSSSGWAASGSTPRGSSRAASRTPLTAEVRDRILAGVPEAIAAVERAIAWYKTDMLRWEEEAATFGNFRSAFMGLVDRQGNVDHYGGWLRVIDADGKFLADRVDPKHFNDYIGEAVEPWSYLKSTYWKAMGYPDGIYRVGPLARLNVAERMGTPRADEELEKFRWRVGRVAGSSFHYHYARLIDTLHAIEKVEELLRGPDILSKHIRSVADINRNEGIGVSEAPRGHADAPLQGGRRRHRGVGEPGHRHRPQQHGHEPGRPPGRPPPRQGRHGSRSRCSTGSRRSSAATTRASSCSTHALGQMAAPDPAAGARRKGPRRAGPVSVPRPPG